MYCACFITWCIRVDGLSTRIVSGLGHHYGGKSDYVGWNWGWSGEDLVLRGFLHDGTLRFKLCTDRLTGQVAQQSHRCFQFCLMAHTHVLGPRRHNAPRGLAIALTWSIRWRIMDILWTFSVNNLTRLVNLRSCIGKFAAQMLFAANLKPLELVDA